MKVESFKNIIIVICLPIIAILLFWLDMMIIIAKDLSEVVDEQRQQITNLGGYYEENRK